MSESIDHDRRDRIAEEYDAMVGFMGVLGGIAVILASQLTFFLSANIANWIAVSAISDHSVYVAFMEVFGLPIMILMICGFIAASLMIVFWLLPITSEYMNISLMRAAGLILILFPLLPFGGYFLSGGTRGYFIGYDLLTWFAFPFIGLIFLSLPELRRQGKLSDDKAWPLILVGASLGLLSSVLFLHGMYTLPGVESSGENYPTPFSLVGLTAGLVILVHSVLMSFVPSELGVRPEE